MRGIFRGDLSAEEYERTHLKFVADAINLEALKASCSGVADRPRPGCTWTRPWSFCVVSSAN